jgi:hypothetical protein
MEMPAVESVLVEALVCPVSDETYANAAHDGAAQRSVRRSRAIPISRFMGRPS